MSTFDVDRTLYEEIGYLDADQPWEQEANPFHVEASHSPARPGERQQAVPGGDFVFGAPVEIPALWGRGGDVLWASGEALMIVGPDGVGKTSLAQQLVLRMCGLGSSELFGLPVARVEHVVYVAADRPRQAQRSFRRMVTKEQWGALNERLTVWRSALPFDLSNEPEALVDFAGGLGAKALVIDSLKDVALDLSKEETGGRVNIAIQATIAAGIETAVLHHQRKGQPGGPAPRKLADVFGSRWLVAGMGSVVMLWGEPGDLVVELRHLKQPGEDAGPFNIVHDHLRGISIREDDRLEFEQLLAVADHGLTPADGARLAYGAQDPKQERNLVEKARRRLEGLVGAGKAERRDDPDGLSRYFSREKA